MKDEKNTEIFKSKIDLITFFEELWRGRLIILFCTLFFCSLGLVVNYFIPDPVPLYKSNATLVYTGRKNENQQDLAVSILQSKLFINGFISKYDLSIPLIAGKNWNGIDRRLILDPSIINIENNELLPKGKALLSSPFLDVTLFEKFKKLTSIDYIRNRGVIKISISYISPDIAKEWLEGIIDMFNLELKNIGEDDIKKRQEYLYHKINNENDPNMINIYYNLMSDMEREFMQLKFKSNFKVVSPPSIPNKPQRFFQFTIGYTVLFSLVIGFMFSVGIIIIRLFYRNNIIK